MRAWGKCSGVIRMYFRIPAIYEVLILYSARNKMEKGDGLSFAELSYPLMQGWDWWHLYTTFEIQMQIGGSDQLGNIIAGKELIAGAIKSERSLEMLGRLKGSLPPLGFTVPLLTTSGGEKYGKSAGNAIWLDPSLTSIFDQYQVGSHHRRVNRLTSVVLRTIGGRRR